MKEIIKKYWKKIKIICWIIFHFFYRPRCRYLESNHLCGFDSYTHNCPLHCDTSFRKKCIYQGSINEK